MGVRVQSPKLGALKRGPGGGLQDTVTGLGLLRGSQQNRTKKSRFQGKTCGGGGGWGDVPALGMLHGVNGVEGAVEGESGGLGVREPTGEDIHVADAY